MQAFSKSTDTRLVYFRGKTPSVSRKHSSDFSSIFIAQTQFIKVAVLVKNCPILTRNDSTFFVYITDEITDVSDVEVTLYGSVTCLNRVPFN